MDLRAYYRKRREMEQTIPGEYVLLKSLATPDGGITGRLTEADRAVAARMIVDGLAEIASAAEREALDKQIAEDRRRAEQKRTAAQLQFTVITEADIRALQRAGKGGAKE